MQHVFFYFIYRPEANIHYWIPYNWNDLPTPWKTSRPGQGYDSYLHKPGPVRVGSSLRPTWFALLIYFRCPSWRHFEVRLITGRGLRIIACTALRLTTGRALRLIAGRWLRITAGRGLRFITRRWLTLAGIGLRLNAVDEWGTLQGDF